jgi:hypothetical protein
VPRRLEGAVDDRRAGRRVEDVDVVVLRRDQESTGEEEGLRVDLTVERDIEERLEGRAADLGGVEGRLVRVPAGPQIVSAGPDAQGGGARRGGSQPEPAGHPPSRHRGPARTGEQQRGQADATTHAQRSPPDGGEKGNTPPWDRVRGVRPLMSAGRQAVAPGVGESPGSGSGQSSQKSSMADRVGMGSTAPHRCATSSSRPCSRAGRRPSGRARRTARAAPSSGWVTGAGAPPRRRRPFRAGCGEVKSAGPRRSSGGTDASTCSSSGCAWRNLPTTSSFSSGRTVHVTWTIRPPGRTRATARLEERALKRRPLGEGPDVGPPADVGAPPDRPQRRARRVDEHRVVGLLRDRLEHADGGARSGALRPMPEPLERLAVDVVRVHPPLTPGPQRRGAASFPGAGTQVQDAHPGAGPRPARRRAGFPRPGPRTGPPGGTGGEDVGSAVELERIGGVPGRVDWRRPPRGGARQARRDRAGAGSRGR